MKISLALYFSLISISIFSQEDTVFITFEGRYIRNSVRVFADDDSLIFKKRLKKKRKSAVILVEQFQYVGNTSKLEVKAGLLKRENIILTKSDRYVFIRRRSFFRPLSVEASDSPRLYW